MRPPTDLSLTQLSLLTVIVEYGGDADLALLRCLVQQPEDVDAWVEDVQRLLDCQFIERIPGTKDYLYRATDAWQRILRSSRPSNGTIVQEPRLTEQLALALAPSERSKVARVLAIIRVHVGRDQAISMHAIAAQVGISTRDVQEIVKVLVEERSKPIGTATSKPYGYYLIRNEDELRQNYQHFVRRGVSNLRHARAYNKASIVGQIVGQLEIEVEVKR